MLTEKSVLHSFRVIAETGHIEVRIDKLIVDSDGIERAPRQPWRGVINPNDSKRTSELLGEKAQAIIASAGWKK